MLDHGSSARWLVPEFAEKRVFKSVYVLYIQLASVVGKGEAVHVRFFAQNDISDVTILANAFLATRSSSNWSPIADLNVDGVVDALDAIILGNHFVQHYP
jgi:hypothetical protein